MTFKKWLLKTAKLNTPAGDLASDIKQDPWFPDTDQYLPGKDYLESRGAIPGAMRAYLNAYKHYCMAGKKRRE